MGWNYKEQINEETFMSGSVVKSSHLSITKLSIFISLNFLCNEIYLSRWTTDYLIMDARALYPTASTVVD